MIQMNFGLRLNMHINKLFLTNNMSLFFFVNNL